MILGTKEKLLDAWAYCDNGDKSTEYMLQYMQDYANVDFDCVMNFLEKTTEEERNDHYEKRKKEALD